ncbi:hypothetical protein LGL55_21190 [Clostridium tagluense]|uniref:hypothetical protein n=1 Tax=Clostridium tagluense TaxID=360422 RepID=UPI001CF48829|nr:hypothetical protein [Clostridium tagluense]MCB2313632.1 hypothetical protein [Clostridium tagluense]MCB2318466.1 hypothetical protein [Clostridium tagluense]MCB2323298.1 hypothetical protein [Clostridium tagluense]MCB2328241.1 hypothetical protein [Clostridium tagluense]MCB2333000.1 hypothetical protein [Clostridium tagluense]
MGTVKQFKNKEPKMINLSKWFSVGAIIGTMLGVILTIYSWIDSGILVISFTILIICSGIGCFVSIALKKWLLRTFWV